MKLRFLVDTSMKKTILLCASILLALPMFSQTLAYRKDTDLFLSIATNYCFEGKPAIWIQFEPRTAVALLYTLRKDNGEEKFCLSFRLQTYEQEFSFDENAGLYIKTFQDNLITLHQVHFCEDVNKSKSHKKVSDRSDSFYYFVDPSYNISKEDLQKIMTEGIKKISFMTTRSYHTLEFENDTLGKIILTEYELVMGKSDFSKDF